MSDKISSFFIRPPRQTYYEHDLGPQIFPISCKKNQSTQMGTRIDFAIFNNRSLKINASFYRLQASSSQKCLIYLHTHHGSRLEALTLIEPMLNSNINLCLFDFSGYGNSQGDTVTLGIEESEDVNHVLETLKKKFEQEYFILWGRSMGAVASLIYLSKSELSRSSHVIGAIYDSPFHSLYELTIEIGSKNIGIPQTLLRPFIYFVKKSLEDKLNFQELELEPIVETIKTPGIFLASKQDKFVSFTHSQKLYRKYGGPKQLIYIDKDHNEPRKQEDLSQIFSFIYKKMNVLQKAQKLNNYLSLFSRHFQFIDQFQKKGMDSQVKNYFMRETNQEEPEPLTERLEYTTLAKKTSKDVFSARPNSKSNQSKTTSQLNYFSKTQKFSKLSQIK